MKSKVEKNIMISSLSFVYYPLLVVEVEAEEVRDLVVVLFAIFAPLLAGGGGSRSVSGIKPASEF